MTTTLITGANKGLGYETARRLISAGHDVWIGARDPERGQAAAAALGARFVRLDVTDDDSVATAATTIDAEHGALDVLVNNAGISAGRTPVPEVTVAELRRVYETNVFGPVRVLQAFAPLLLRSSSPVVVNVSSGMGSLAVTTDPERLESRINGLAYPSSKSALNMLTSQYAKAYPSMRINAVDPGYTATDLNGRSGIQDGRAGRGDHRARRVPRRRRAHRSISRRRGRRAVVSSGARESAPAVTADCASGRRGAPSGARRATCRRVPARTGA